MKRCLECQSVFDQDWPCPACGHAPQVIEGYPAFAPALAFENDGFPAESFANLARLEANHFWFQMRNRLIIWALHTYFPEARNFLEVGCGTGFVLSGIHEAASEVAMFGSELYATALQFAASRVPDATLFQMDARAIPFVDEYDIIGAFDVLEHIDDDEAVLAQFYQALAPGGGLLLTVPQHQFLWSVVDEYSRHARRYTTVELQQKVERAGMTVVKTTSFVSLLLPLMFASRLRTPQEQDAYDPTTELDLNDTLNSVLKKFLNVELGLIKAGASLPWGGSRLLIARKS